MEASETKREWLDTLLEDSSETAIIRDTELPRRISVEGVTFNACMPTKPYYRSLAYRLHDRLQSLDPITLYPASLLGFKDTTVWEGCQKEILALHHALREVSVPKKNQAPSGWFNLFESHEDPSVIAKRSAVRQFIQNAGVSGVAEILGLRHSPGTIEGALPPDVATLTQSFNTGTKPGSKLTVGARALSKHCERGADRFWGEMKGNDSRKNERAHLIMLRILQNAVWINIHQIVHKESLLEVRMVEGYGLRWNADGTKFRGLLEPQDPQGHDKRWRH
ncbi:hypothetical protein CYMTET_31902 [Cymbomonas tetramitiformis]|uniref:Uncharacterized protein n=1 Tax=Cymbomonas tetramitiformis TaxID=36881 RepID=A0AAE0FGV6_9CHLO|nr:hypothetical protein CYMTET_31902 [Cymbomonas tetramitiformis]